MQKLKTFFGNIKAEMKRVTYPTKQEVMRWTIVVIAALIFFGVLIFIIDNFAVTPFLIGVSSFA